VQAALEKPEGAALDASPYFCQVRFLWRFARSCLRRLCLLIFALRRFFSDPINDLFSQHQYTTLFNGYSMIPSAPAALS
jgi:hypothetical protein